MLSATVTMDKMRRKNGFESTKFNDIKQNFLVSLFICIGYAFDYTSDVTTTILLIEEVIDFNQEAYIISINRIVLTVCIFAAYTILIKIFMTYQN